MFVFCIIVNIYVGFLLSCIYVEGLPYLPTSSQMAAVLSNEHVAKTCPNSGCAQVTFHTEPWCAFQLAVSRHSPWPSASQTLNNIINLKQNPLICARIIYSFHKIYYCFNLNLVTTKWYLILWMWTSVCYAFTSKSQNR